jgi:hypothetical protein
MCAIHSQEKYKGNIDEVVKHTFTKTNCSTYSMIIEISKPPLIVIAVCSVLHPVLVLQKQSHRKAQNLKAREAKKGAAKKT